MFGERIRYADWRTEKHAPVIECPDEVRAGEPFVVRVAVGKGIAHPNTTEHHISWIEVFFHPDGEKYAAEAGRFECVAHAESVEGPNQGALQTLPAVTLVLKVSSPGTVHVLAYCNVHGLWENTHHLRLR